MEVTPNNIKTIRFWAELPIEITRAVGHEVLLMAEYLMQAPEEIAQLRKASEVQHYE